MSRMEACHLLHSKLDSGPKLIGVVQMNAGPGTERDTKTDLPTMESVSSGQERIVLNDFSTLREQPGRSFTDTFRTVYQSFIDAIIDAVSIRVIFGWELSKTIIVTEMKRVAVDFGEAPSARRPR